MENRSFPQTASSARRKASWKTYAVRRSGLQFKFKSFVEINFEKLKGAASLFEKDLVPEGYAAASMAHPNQRKALDSLVDGQTAAPSFLQN